MANPSDYKYRIDQLTVARKVFEKDLEYLNLLPSQIEKQSLEELEESLKRVREESKKANQYGTWRVIIDSDVGVCILNGDAEFFYKVNILPVLLESEKLILNRKKLLINEKKIDSLHDISANIKDPKEFQQKIKDELGELDRNGTEEIDNQLREIEKREEEISIELKNEQIKVEILKKRSEIWHSFLERESVATIVGALLLLIITVAEIVSNPSDVVNNAFLLILGYFFGQSVSKTANK